MSAARVFVGDRSPLVADGMAADSGVGPVSAGGSEVVGDRPKLHAARYVCYACGVCIATADCLEDGGKNATSEALTFRRLRIPADTDKEAKTLLCPWCTTPLGRSRGDGASLVRRDRVVMRPEGLEILLCGLKEQDIESIKPVMQSCFPEVALTTLVLKKAELRGFSLSHTPSFGPDLVVVVHRNEGRVMLTDRNGFYNDVLASAWQRSAGNVAVVLTRADAGPDGSLYDRPLLKSLSEEGGQPTVGVLGGLGRLLTWGTAPSPSQVAQLGLLATKAYCREPAVQTQGVPAHWVQKPAPKASAAMWCNLL